jgi:hypothetical protein
MAEAKARALVLGILQEGSKDKHEAEKGAVWQHLATLAAEQMMQQQYLTVVMILLHHARRDVRLSDRLLYTALMLLWLLICMCSASSAEEAWMQHCCFVIVCGRPEAT